MMPKKHSGAVSDELSEINITAAGQAKYSDPGHASRLGWLIMLVGFGGFLLWAAFAPLDKGVTLQGTVVISGNHKQVKPLYSGIVRSINVKEGDKVNGGQLLLEMDTTQKHAQLKIYTVQLLQKQIEEARLLAERDGLPDLVFNSTYMQSELFSPLINDVLALQRRFLATRRTTLQKQIAVMQENAEGLKAQAQALEDAHRAKLEQYSMLQGEISGLRELAVQGFFPRNRLSERERELSRLTESISLDKSNLAHIRSAVSEVNLNIIKHEKENQREIEAKLTELRRDIDNLENQVRSLDFEVDNASIYAPKDGIVAEMKIHTIGGIVQGGELLMEIVPVDQPLTISADIPTNLIDKIKPGLPVDIRFSALNYQITPVLPGELVKISPDVIHNEKTGISVYKISIKVTEEGMHKIKDHQIIAGMPADVFIRTGERTLLSYLFRPIMVRFEAAMQEE